MLMCTHVLVSLGMSKHQPDQDLHGDWQNSHPAEPGEPLRESV